MQGMVGETKGNGLTLERLLADLRGLERGLDARGVEVALGEREGGMPRLMFDGLDGRYITRRFDEFRHEMIRLLAGRYERKAADMPAEWGRLSGGGPMPDNLTQKAREYGRMADRHDLRLLDRRDPRLRLSESDATRLRDMGLVARRYVLVDVFDELNDKGEKAVEYMARTMGVGLK